MEVGSSLRGNKTIYCFLSSYVEVEGCFPPYIVPKGLDWGLVNFGVATFGPQSRVGELDHVEEPGVENLVPGVYLWLLPLRCETC